MLQTSVQLAVNKSVRPIKHAVSFGNGAVSNLWTWNPGHAEFVKSRDYCARNYLESKGALEAFAAWICGEVSGTPSLIFTAPEAVATYDLVSGRLGFVRADYDNSYVAEDVQADGTIVRRPIVLNKADMPKVGYLPLRMSGGQLTTWPTEELSLSTLKLEGWMNEEEQKAIKASLVRYYKLVALSAMLKGVIVSAKIGSFLEEKSNQLEPIFNASSLEEAKKLNADRLTAIISTRKEQREEVVYTDNLKQTEGLSDTQIAQLGCVVHSVDGGEIDLAKLPIGTSVWPINADGMRGTKVTIRNLQKEPEFRSTLVAKAALWNQKGFKASLR